MTPHIAMQLVRNNIRNTPAYKSARSGTENSDTYIFLDAAENSISPFQDEDGFTPLINRYPDPQPATLKDKLAALYDVSADNLMLTRGSEEAIRLVLQTFCEPHQDSLLTCPPTFALYDLETKIQSIGHVKIAREGRYDTQLNLNTIKNALNADDQNVKVVMICNPGNPSSTSVDQDDMRALLDLCRDKAILVIDEAYIEFAEHESYASVLSENKNLVILRTLSKAYGLAGLRCGAIIADDLILDYIARVIAPYPVPRPTVETALAALTTTRIKTMQDVQATLKSERDRMVKALQSAPHVRRIFPSATNFLTIQVDDVEETLQKFLRNHLVIRDRSSAIANAVNIAVSDAYTNDKVIDLFS